MSMQKLEKEKNNQLTAWAVLDQWVSAGSVWLAVSYELCGVLAELLITARASLASEVV